MRQRDARDHEDEELNRQRDESPDRHIDQIHTVLHGVRQWNHHADKRTREAERRRHVVLADQGNFAIRRDPHVEGDKYRQQHAGDGEVEQEVVEAAEGFQDLVLGHGIVLFEVVTQNSAAGNGWCFW